MVNPNGKNPTIYDEANDLTYYDKDVSDRVPYMIRNLVYIWSVLVFLTILLIKRKDEVVVITRQSESGQLENGLVAD